MSEKASRFLKPEKLTKEKERRKRETEEKERRRREKSNGCALSFYNSYFGEFLAQKNCWTQKVHLAISFSKIRLDLNLAFYSVNFRL